MSRHFQSRRGAFTLVELMVVVIIIGILAGLLSVAVYNAVIAARKAAVKAEIDSIHMAMVQYSTDRGEAPPCLGDRDSAGGNPTRQQRFLAHLRKAFPRYTPAPPNQYDSVKTYVSTTYSNTQFGAPLNIDHIDQAEALVLWLGGPPTTPSLGSSTKLIGWSADVSNPFKPNGSRKESHFAFVEARLVDLDRDGWWEYVPSVTSSTGPTPPYVFFDAASYEKLKVQFYPCPLKYPPYKVEHDAMIDQWGVAVPYLSQITSPTSATVVNPKTFQIISAGLDSIYTLEDYQGPGALDKFPVFPSGMNYAPGEKDNLTNFSEGTLEDAIK